MKFSTTLATGALVLASSVSHAAEPAPGKFSVMQFNVWQEGTSVPDGLSKIAEVVVRSGSDIVTFSEVRNYGGKDWHTKLLAELKKHGGESYVGKFAGGDVGLVSKFPIVSTEQVYTGSGSVIAYRLRLPEGRLITVCSAHIDYTHYGLNLVRGYNGGDPDWNIRDADKDGKPDPVTSVPRILAYEAKSQRGPAIAAFLKFAAKEAAEKHAVILAGDFNEASPLDWTPRAAREIHGHYGVAVPWPTGTKLLAEGFTDGYRKVFPDEVAYPGITWPAVADIKKSTSWVPLSDDRDRIDFIYYKGSGITAKTAAVVGPRKAYAYDKPADNPGKDPFLCDTLPWPSDHKAVRVEFALGAE